MAAKPRDLAKDTRRMSRGLGPVCPRLPPPTLDPSSPSSPPCSGAPPALDSNGGDGASAASSCGGGGGVAGAKGTATLGGWAVCEKDAERGRAGPVAPPLNGLAGPLRADRELARGKGPPGAPCDPASLLPRTGEPSTLARRLPPNMRDMRDGDFGGPASPSALATTAVVPIPNQTTSCADVGARRGRGRGGDAATVPRDE